MFWKRKPELPITLEDQLWVEESLTFLKESLGRASLLKISTVTPTKDFFNLDFNGSEADAQLVFERCLDIMNISREKVLLEFYSEENRYLDDGTLLSTSADSMGRSSKAAGTFQKKGGKAIIRIEKGQLKNLEDLIATISHELAHEKLLGEHRILENDEYLTDLTAIAFGFGIFIANAKFQFQSGQGGGFGWRIQSQGYLPEQISAYAMASLSLKKNEDVEDYKDYLDKSVQKYFERSLAYLESNQHNKDISIFWPVTKKDTDAKATQYAELSKEKVGYTLEDLESLREEMCQACYESDIKTVEALLQKSGSPNFFTIWGSPLTIAVKRANKELIDCLLHYGADINFSDTKSLMGVLPLMAACENENIAMMGYLIDFGAEIDRVDGNGKSILQTAVETENIELTQFLLDKGANIEIKSGLSMNFDRTPLCAAVMQNNVEMVSFLVKNGAKTKPIRKLPRYEIHPKMVKFLKARKYL